MRIFLPYFSGVWAKNPNIEIKSPEAVEATLQVLRGHLSTHRFIVTSFFHNLLPYVADTLGVECGALVAHQPYDILNFLRELRQRHPRITTVVWPYELLSRDTASIARRQGLRTFVYDVELPADFSHCHSLSIDAVITNRPDVYRTEFVNPLRSSDGR